MDLLDTTTAILVLVWGFIFVAFIAIIGGHLVARMLKKQNQNQIKPIKSL